MLPTVKLQNLGPAGPVPFTFGQVFAPGHVKQGDLLSAGGVALQVDGKAKHPDGSLRHAVLSGLIDKMDVGEVRALPLEKLAPRSSVIAPKPGFDMARAVRVELTIAGVKYIATPNIALGMHVWLQGPVVDEWHVSAPLRDGAGVEHSHLTVRVAARIYSGVPYQGRMEVLVENCKTFAVGAHFNYDAAIYCGDALLYSRVAISHYHHARWRQTFWLDAARAPAAHVIQDLPYLISTRAIPNYDLGIRPDETALALWEKRTTSANTGPMKIGPVANAMPGTGGRHDIAPLPGWTVAYLLSADMRAHKAMTAAAEGAGTWPTHYRDENTGYPVRTDNDKNKGISVHMNLANRGPLPVPRYITGTPVPPYEPDTSHQPSFAYLPYLISGDYFYLEELQFWAAWNPLQTDPTNHGMGAGLVKWQQIRGQAWSLRTLGHAAYITPDAHPLKEYFTKQVQNNVDFYHQTYVVGNPNALGMYDGSGRGSFPLGGPPAGIRSAPFQDDYFTWAIGNLVDLGFESARPLLEWKARYIVNRLTSPDFPWTHGADFSYRVRVLPTDPIASTMGEVFQLTYGQALVDDNRKTYVHPKGVAYSSVPLDDEAQAQWITEARGTTWKPGRMLGYADSIWGYPANMQPALALITDHNVPGAREAWAKYDSRADKPKWQEGAQFNVIPRPVPVVEVEPPPPPAPNERCLVEAAIQRYATAPDETAVEQRALAQEVFGLLLDSERARTIAQQSDKPQG